MSLGIAFKGSEGVVLAADSRVTLMTKVPTAVAGQVVVIPATFDNATKLLKVKGQDYVGAVTYGLGALGQTEPRTAHSFLTEFEAQLGASHPDRISVEDFARELSNFFMNKWREAGMPATVSDPEQMVFLVGGYDEGAVYGRLFEVYVPNKPEPKEQLATSFGALFGGQREFVDRLLNGYDGRLPEFAKSELGLSGADEAKLKAKLNQLAIPIPYQFLPLQDCVDLSVFLIRTTINLQTWQIGVRGVGGAIDVASITQTDGFKPLQQKAIRVTSQKREKSEL